MVRRGNVVMVLLRSKARCQAVQQWLYPESTRNIRKKKNEVDTEVIDILANQNVRSNMNQSNTQNFHHLPQPAQPSAGSYGTRVPLSVMNMTSNQVQQAMLFSEFPVLSGKIWTSIKLLQPRSWKDPAQLVKKSKTSISERREIRTGQCNNKSFQRPLGNSSLSNWAADHGRKHEPRDKHGASPYLQQSLRELPSLDCKSHNNAWVDPGFRVGCGVPPSPMVKQYSMGYTGPKLAYKVLPEKDKFNSSRDSSSGKSQRSPKGMQLVQQQKGMCKRELPIPSQLLNMSRASLEETMPQNRECNHWRYESQQETASLTRLARFAEASSTQVGKVIQLPSGMASNEGYNSEWTRTLRKAFEGGTSSELPISNVVRGETCWKLCTKKFNWDVY